MYNGYTQTSQVQRIEQQGREFLILFYKRTTKDLTVEVITTFPTQIPH